jgi:hypothetical protein
MLDILPIIFDFISQCLTMFGITIMEYLGGKSCSECMMSKDDTIDKNLTSPEKETIIATVIKRAPQIKSYEEYKSNITDSFNNDITKVDIHKEIDYTDLKGYKEKIESSKEFTKTSSVGLAGLLTAGATKNLGFTNSGTIGSILGASYYSLMNAHLDDKKQEYDLQMQIQEGSFSKGAEKLGEDRVKELAKIRCEENGLFENEYNVAKFNKASGDLYKDVSGKK